MEHCFAHGTLGTRGGDFIKRQASPHITSLLETKEARPAGFCMPCKPFRQSDPHCEYSRFVHRSFISYLFIYHTQLTGRKTVPAVSRHNVGNCGGWGAGIVCRPLRLGTVAQSPALGQALLRILQRPLAASSYHSYSFLCKSPSLCKHCNWQRR